MIGKTVSHYRVLEELGRGGMGIVYKALDAKLERTVALKFLSHQALGTSDEKARFLHEAQAAAALSHPNICTIYEIDEFEEASFIAMECIEGESLRSKIESGPLKLEQAIDITMQAAAGLQEAHEKGIIHRDIKPANIMITRRGRIKIMDFGLAKARGQTMLTREGTTLGTVSYMSPEQARGDDADERSDLWSLGVVLYEMVTGRRPFGGSYEQAIVYSILSEGPEPVTALRTGVPLELERIIAKSLEKDPAERYQTAAGLISDLRHMQKIMDAQSRAPKTTGREASEPQRPAPAASDRPAERVAPTGAEEPAPKAATPKSQATMQATTPASSRQPAAGKRYAWIGWVFVALVLALLLTQVIPRFLPPGVSDGQQAFAERSMIVVLPFENLGPPEEAYFAEGITEEITSRLASISGLGVISRTSAVQYDRAGKTVKQIGEDLGVDYMLEGTIRWNKSAAGGSRVRITPQLIRVSDDTHLWAESYDRVLEDIFAVQSDIAERIIAQLGISMLARERDALEVKPTDDLLAYEAYLRGLVQMRKAGSSEEIWRRAETLFQQAVDLDSSFAIAYAKLSEVHGELYYWGFDKSEGRLAKSKAAVDRALALQPELPEAHFALSSYYYMGFFDFDRALRELAIAARGMPNSPKVLETVAYIWRRQGLYHDAIDNLKKAALLDPKQSWYLNQIGWTYSVLHECEKADRYLDSAIAMEPSELNAYWVKYINILQCSGDLHETRRIIEAIEDQSPVVVNWIWFWQLFYERDYAGALSRALDAPEEITEIPSLVHSRDLIAAYAYRQLGEDDKARASGESAMIRLEAMVRDAPDHGGARIAVAQAYALLGRKEDALREAERAMELVAFDKITSMNYESIFIKICLLLGENEAALDSIEHQLSRPSYVTIPFLEVDPLCDPIRDHPRYIRLKERYSGSGA